jgi:hypothetical protein
MAEIQAVIPQLEILDGVSGILYITRESRENYNSILYAVFYSISPSTQYNVLTGFNFSEFLLSIISYKK